MLHNLHNLLSSKGTSYSLIIAIISQCSEFSLDLASTGLVFLIISGCCCFSVLIISLY